MTDDQQPAPESPEPPSSEPAADRPPAEPEYPDNFGQQVGAKAGLPPDLQTRSREIEGDQGNG